MKYIANQFFGTVILLTAQPVHPGHIVGDLLFDDLTNLTIPITDLDIATIIIIYTNIS